MMMMMMMMMMMICVRLEINSVSKPALGIILGKCSKCRPKLCKYYGNRDVT
jgi:exosome complex RNA-binding protein Csl4